MRKLGIWFFTEVYPDAWITPAVIVVAIAMYGYFAYVLASP